ncbi:DUF418 domain-containing protein [Bacillus carboniphilus]|uniref:DUF418 domain-containing protein n=1 Tax=Bacillus carboniphilus TaxID=86663 RepID=A0ABY9JUC6_9BACI|nr:DUF418 domain-containing protein [Bacillus carboniphilus]WLR42088.1 DUF418 domain-containing protein [Bacillus carboniphilus]
MDSQSVLGKERIISLDVIRGFALLGILLVNMPSHSGSDLFFLSGMDKQVLLFFHLFIQTKFYTIFSFLFGLGFYIFMTRAEKKELAVNRLFSRRLFFLLLFGILHFALFWEGDILTTYALVGFILILFYKRKPRTILIWAISLMTFYLLLLLLGSLSGTSIYEIDEGMVNYSIEEGEEKVAAYTSLSYLDLVKWRWADSAVEYFSNNLFIVFDILAVFLIGLLCGKLKVFNRVKELKNRFRRLQISSLLLSVPTSIIIYKMFALTEDVTYIFSLWQLLFITLSGITLATFYITTITLALEKAFWSKMLNPLRYVGQMALTNYLAQTVITFIIFYGFGLFGQITLSQGVIFSIILYILQIAFSYIWLKNYQFGPMEWLWRWLTYGKKPAMKKRMEVEG